MLKVLSWNINGMRSIIKKGFVRWVQHENPHILCLQETRATEGQVDVSELEKEYKVLWNPGEKVGYSGTMMFSKLQPKEVRYGFHSEDKEGRVITCIFETFSLVNVYAPIAQEGLVKLPYRLKWDSDLLSHIKSVKQEIPNPVILCGDLNVAHTDMDIAYAHHYRGTYCFTNEEKANFSKLLEEGGFCDTWRYFNRDRIEYTYWNPRTNARMRNAGWRVDYFCCDNQLVSSIKKVWIMGYVFGSDHCPIGLELDWENFGKETMVK